MVGQRVSHYRIVEKVGSGGMGVVYRAEDTRLKRTVALKFLPEEWRLDPERRRRFIREARAVSALDHPNIVTLYDVGEADGRDFIVMQFVPGTSLRDLIGCLRLREALVYAIQIADGLAAAHARGIIHRDLKPENVIVAENDVVKILDFGLAKPAESPAPVASEAPTQGIEKPRYGGGFHPGDSSLHVSRAEAVWALIDPHQTLSHFSSKPLCLYV